MGEHSTREREIDDWLRQEVLVDLYRVVKQALRAGVTSYSIKEIEKLYGFVRTAEVSGGDESVVLFEQWLEAGEDALLEGIRAYNEEDCRSTVALHEWLLGLRPPDLPWRAPPDEREQTEEAEERDAARVALHEALLDGRGGGEPALAPRAPPLLPPPRGEVAVVGVVPPPRARRGRADRGHGHDRRARARRRAGRGRAVARLHVRVPAAGAQDRRARASIRRRRRRTSCTVDDEHGLVTLGARRTRADEPLPAALIPTRRSPTGSSATRSRGSRSAYLDGERERRRSSRCSSGGCRGRGSTSRCPRPRSRSTAATSSCRARPGSGKTWQGAKAAVALMRAGRRVGVTSLSHKAIEKLLDGDRARGARAGLRVQGPQEVARATRTRASRASSSTRATTGATCSTRSSSSSRARRGSSRARTSRASSTR